MKKNPNALFTFHYSGISKFAQKTSGDIEARSIAFAKAELHKQGIVLHKIVKKRSPFYQQQYQKIKSSDITVFSRQLATMIESGIPLIQAFACIAKGQGNKSLQTLIDTIKQDVETGLTLAEALKKHPVHFNQLFCNLVEAGEKSGTLDIMLHKIATYKDRTYALTAM